MKRPDLMKTFITTPFFVFLLLSSAAAQDFPFGKVRVDDLSMTTYAGDTSAAAVVLKEFGEAFISDDDYHLIYRYHVRIKILKKNGLDQANIEIPLHRQGNDTEELQSVRASSFNIENNGVREESLREKDVYTEDVHKYVILKKFAIPSVRVGTVIELAYTLESPFIFNFRTWEFQSDIPKVESEYFASIPGIYLYNITLRGYQKLSRNESQIVKACLGSSGASLNGQFSADCQLMKFGMKNIPAFVEENYMTAKKNFLSAIHFELSEVRHPDGRVDKVTKEWKDAEQELRQESRFGVQLRRGKDIGDEVKKLVGAETDAFAKARKVYDFIKDWYVWNGTYGKYSELGIRKAYDERKGNVGDINLSLVAALRFAGLDVEPVILSTRANGSVVELHPVLSEFNYIVAKVNIGEKVYLADATEKLYPFGLLPERCLNGKGRVIGEDNSYWVDLKPAVTGRTISAATLTLGNDGVMRGSVQTTFAGYDAVGKRQQILSHSSVDEYIQELARSLNSLGIKGYQFQGLEDPDKPLIRKLEIEIHAFDPDAVNFLFNPFFLEKWSENPFKSGERLYPVDFGVPLDRISVFKLDYPAEFEIVNVPEKIGVSLPQGGGRFLFEAQNAGSTFTMNHNLSISKSVYSSVEYHYLKELFNRIIQVQNGELIFKKKT